MNKIYVNDSEIPIPYNQTNVKAKDTKWAIIRLFEKWGIEEYMWLGGKKEGKIGVVFKINEAVKGYRIQAEIAVLCPTHIYKKTRKGDVIDWDVAMRMLYWHIKSRIESSYFMNMPMVKSFQGHINRLSLDGEQVPIQELLALPVRR